MRDVGNPIIVAVKFKFSEKTYDYFSLFPVEVGQSVVVETKRGEATVTVAAIKTSSLNAEKFIIRIAENAGAKS